MIKVAAEGLQGARRRNPETSRTSSPTSTPRRAALSRDEARARRRTIPALRDVRRARPPGARRARRRAAVAARVRPRRAARRASRRGRRCARRCPFIRQARLLVSEDELQRPDARPARRRSRRSRELNRGTIPLLDENRALSRLPEPGARCRSPTTPIPDPDFPDNSGQPFYKQAPARLRRPLRREPHLRRELAALPRPVRHRPDHGRLRRPRRGASSRRRPSAPAGIRPIRPERAARRSAPTSRARRRSRPT